MNIFNHQIFNQSAVKKSNNLFWSPNYFFYYFKPIFCSLNLFWKTLIFNLSYSLIFNISQRVSIHWNFCSKEDPSWKYFKISCLIGRRWSWGVFSYKFFYYAAYKREIFSSSKWFFSSRNLLFFINYCSTLFSLF